MGNNVSSASSNLDRGTYSPRSADKTHKYNTTPRRWTGTTEGSKAQSEHKHRQRDEPTESSRLFFLLYLLHRTWNVVKDKGKGQRIPNEDFDVGASFFDDDFDLNFSDFDEDSETNSLNDSICSSCSCSRCDSASCNSFETINNNKDTATSRYKSKADKGKLIYCFGDSMAPSSGRTPPGTQNGPPSANDWNMLDMKENQRPPVYNPEDYVQSLKKYGRRPSGTIAKSIYDTVEEEEQQQRSATLPGKFSSSSESKSQMAADMESEMSLRQFGSVTDLLSKLRADLRASFPSFVQEFVAGPLDGVSLLLEVLRAIQLSQAGTATGTMTLNTTIMQRTSPTYQRRALLDELACLQCISLCCGRVHEACVRLGTSAIGLLPLAASATGQGIKSRLISLQLLTTACDRNGDGIQRSGHASVSEALSTLRLRCGEPVRFRLLVGMFNSGGGTGELQATGLKFINTFLDSAENSQNRLYLEAELIQAGLEPHGMLRMINDSSPWFERIQQEIKIWDENRIDIEKLAIKARDSDKMKSQMVILERRIQIMQEEKTVLTSMERRLQERCAELQREIFRLQGKDIGSGKLEKGVDGRPVAMPRQSCTSADNNFSEQEDEGISSSETGQSASPEPTRVLLNLGSSNGTERKDDDDAHTTIEDVIEELENIVSDAERDMSSSVDKEMFSQRIRTTATDEHEIIPVNLLPQPPRKSRSLSHLVSNSSDIDDGDFELLMKSNQNDSPSATNGSINNHHQRENSGAEMDKQMTQDTSTNRAILNVIMDAREQEYSQLQHHHQQQLPHPMLHHQPIQSLDVPLQQFNGVFFMSDMKSNPKYQKPDLATLFDNRKVSKSLDRRQTGLESMVDIVMTSPEMKSQRQEIFLKHSGSGPHHHNNGHHLHHHGVAPSGQPQPQQPSPQQQQNNLSPFKIKTGHFNAGLYSGTHLLKENMRHHSKPNSKLTDFPSGLY